MRAVRTTGHNGPRPPRSNGRGPAAEAQGGEARDRLAAILDRNPAKQRAALVLRELEELSYSEIAEVLDVPVGTVMSRLARARERLTSLVGRSPDRTAAREILQPRSMP